MLTFQNLQDEVLGWLDEGDNTTASATTLARVKSALNSANAKRASARRWRFMLQEPPLTFPTVVGQRVYTLDATVHVPVYFWNDTRNMPMFEFDPEDVPTRDYTGASATLTSDYGLGTIQGDGYTLGNASITLTWTPTAVETISYGFYKKPVNMTVDADLPNIPFPHSHILIADAQLKMAAYNEDIGGAKLQIVLDERQELQEALDSAYGQENSQFQTGRYVHYIP